LLKRVKGHIISTLKKLALIEFEAVEDQPAIVMPNNAALKQELEDLRVKLANYERDSAS